MTVVHIPARFHENCLKPFHAILFTDRRTQQQQQQ